MAIACGRILVAAFLPRLFATPAEAGGDGRDRDDRAPREFPDRQAGWRARAHRAQLSGHEAFPPFAAAVR